ELRGAIIPGIPDLLARVDLLVETDHELIVTDLKSSRSRWNRYQAEDSGPQLLLYGELARRLMPDKALRLEFTVVTKTKMPNLETHIVSVNAHQIARTKQIVERVWRAIEAGVFYPAPSPMNC